MEGYKKGKLTIAKAFVKRLISDNCVFISCHKSRSCIEIDIFSSKINNFINKSDYMRLAKYSI